MSEWRNSPRVRRLYYLDNLNLSHLGSRLSLRKNKLEDFILNKRIKHLDVEEFEERQLEINQEDLRLANDFYDQLENVSDREYFINELLFENDINKVKYALRAIRNDEIKLVEYGEDDPDIDFDDRIFDRIVYLLFEVTDLQIIVTLNNISMKLATFLQKLRTTH